MILAKTVKGYGLGANFEARNATHQMKKLTAADLKVFRDLMQIPVTDAQIDEDSYQVPYYNPGPDAPEIAYLQERRRELGGYVPERRNAHRPLDAARREGVRRRPKGSRKQMAATTMAFVRLLRDLMRDKGSGRGSCRSSPTRRAPSGWTRSSRPPRSTTRTVSSTPPSTGP